MSDTNSNPGTARSAVPYESFYSATELAEQHDLFETSYEIVAVALRLAGKKKATFEEAKTIVEKFKIKEVK